MSYLAPSYEERSPQMRSIVAAGEGCFTTQKRFDRTSDSHTPGPKPRFRPPASGSVR
jgi:hypothetical protein